MHIKTQTLLQGPVSSQFILGTCNFYDQISITKSARLETQEQNIFIFYNSDTICTHVK